MNTAKNLEAIIALDKASNIIYPSFIVIPSWFI